MIPAYILVDLNIGRVTGYNSSNLYKTYFSVVNETNINGQPIIIDAIPCSEAFEHVS